MSRTKKKAQVFGLEPLQLIPGSDLLSHPPARAVPSAVASLTSVFGMGTGVTLLLWPPGNLVPGISAYAPQRRFGVTSLRGLSTVAGVSQRRRNRPRAYCDLTSQSFDRYLEFLSNSINRNIKLPAVPVWGTVAEYSAMSNFSDHTFTIKRSE